MDIATLQKEYELARVGEGYLELDIGKNVRRMSKLVRLLASDHSSETIQFHYQLLKHREDHHLYCVLRAVFKERPEAEEFLLQQFQQETAPVALGDILKMLGEKRSPQALLQARKFIFSDNVFQREVALGVLGLIGVAADIAFVHQLLLHDDSAYLRRVAARELKQMYRHLSGSRNDILRIFKEAFETETDPEVLTWIIYELRLALLCSSSSTIREDEDDTANLYGDLAEAKQETAEYFSGLSL